MFPSFALLAGNPLCEALAVMFAPIARLVDEVGFPVPDRLTTSGLFAAVLFTVSVPARVPAALGVNVTEAEHDAPTASELPQLLVCA